MKYISLKKVALIGTLIAASFFQTGSLFAGKPDFNGEPAPTGVPGPIIEPVLLVPVINDVSLVLNDDCTTCTFPSVELHFTLKSRCPASLSLEIRTPPSLATNLYSLRVVQVNLPPSDVSTCENDAVKRNYVLYVGVDESATYTIDNRLGL